MSKQFIAVVALVILGLFAVFAFTKKPASQQSGSSPNSSQLSSHKEGAGKKGVSLIEYGDLQCPACKAYYPIVKQIRETYGDDITFEFRHFPLVQLHQHAFEAARAAEAAGNQGKFFEMHDMMYENQDSWSQSSNVSAIFEGYASQLGLNIGQFKTDVISSKTSDIINADIKAGQAIGADSTPTFVLDGKKIGQNPQSLDAFKQLIDNEIAKVNKK